MKLIFSLNSRDFKLGVWARSAQCSRKFPGIIFLIRSTKKLAHIRKIKNIHWGPLNLTKDLQNAQLVGCTHTCVWIFNFMNGIHLAMVISLFPVLNTSLFYLSANTSYVCVHAIIWLAGFFIYIFLPVATKSIVLDFKMMRLHFPF